MTPPILRVLAAASLLLGACGNDASPTSDAPAGQQIVPVTVMTVEASAASALYAFPAQVEGDRRVVVSTTLMARIDRIAVQEGDRVAEGDVLVELDQSALRAEKARAEAMRQQAKTALTAARNQFDRFTALRERGSATERELEEVRTMHEQAQAALAAAESAVAAVAQQLTYAVITSPVTGHAVARYADPGTMAQPGQPILEVETTSDLRVVALVPESQVSQLSEGDTVFVDMDAVGARFQGRLATINQAASAPARQYRVEVDRLEPLGDGSGGGLKPGMYARLHVSVRPVGDEERIIIPAGALVTRGQLTGVWAVSDSNRARLRWVRLGARRGDEVEVLSGLRAGERIVLSARGRITDGQEVREQ